MGLNQKVFLTVPLLLCFSMLCEAKGSGPKWELISTTNHPDKTISWYVDMTSVVHEDDYMRANLRTSWSTPQYGPNQVIYQSSTYLNYFDCGTGRIAFTNNAYFFSTEPVGPTVHQEEELPLEKLKFQQVVPGSAGATRMEFVCQFRSKNFRT